LDPSGEFTDEGGAMVNLEQAKKLILDEWRTEIFGGKFRPPVEVGEYLKSCTSRIVSGVVKIYMGKKVKGFESAIEDYMRFMATDKNLSPGEAVITLLNLKKVILRIFPDMSMDEYLRLDDLMSYVAIVAFNTYSSIREEIFELRLMEKDREKMMLEKSIELALQDQEFRDNFKITRRGKEPI
jgi:hypothetical protein